MLKKSYTLLYIIVAMLFCLSCDNRTIYSHYEHTPLQGWEKNDALDFGTVIPQDGYYLEKVGVRINSDYPFMGLTLIVDQTFYPSMQTICDTLDCSLVGKDGNRKGQGISHFQYEFPLKTLGLNEGDSVSVRIHHTMKREILPGISNIGVILQRH